MIQMIKLRFTLKQAGKVDVKGAFEHYAKEGTTLTRPFEATQVDNYLN